MEYNVGQLPYRMSYKQFRDILNLLITGEKWSQVADSYGVSVVPLRTEFEDMVEAQKTWHMVKDMMGVPGFTDQFEYEDDDMRVRDIIKIRYPELTYIRLLKAMRFFNLLKSDADDVNSIGAPSPTSYGTVWTEAWDRQRNLLKRLINLPM